jgi:hypothetical protein
VLAELRTIEKDIIENVLEYHKSGVFRKRRSIVSGDNIKSNKKVPISSEEMIESIRDGLRA